MQGEILLCLSTLNSFCGIQIIDKMEAAGLIEPVHTPRVLRFNFEDVGKLPPPIIAFSDVAFSYDGNMKNALYKDLSLGIE